MRPIDSEQFDSALWEPREAFRHPQIARAARMSVHQANGVEEGRYALLEDRAGPTWTSEPLNWKDLCRYVLSFLPALEAMHGDGLIHGPMLPGSLILLEGGQLFSGLGLDRRLLDWSPNRPHALQEASYCAPEALAEGGSVSSDQYHIGVRMYEALWGQHPFADSEGNPVLARMLTQTPSALDPLDPSTPDSLRQAVLRCLRPRAAARFGDLESLRKILSGLLNQARP